MIWLGGGQTSLSYYNSTNKKAQNSPGFYFGNSYGQANASFVNVLSCNATINTIFYSDSKFYVKISNFYKNQVLDPIYYFIQVADTSSSVDHCVFSENTAKIFINKQISFTYCSFNRNSFSSISPYLSYNGSHSFIVNTLCHLGKQHDCLTVFSRVTSYFTIYSFLFSLSLFTLV